METFTCPFCGMTSAHPLDVREQYCGHCHVFVADEIMWRLVRSLPPPGHALRVLDPTLSDAS